MTGTTAQNPQLQAYYQWLRDRGQAYPHAPRGVKPAQRALAFIGDGEFTADEREMLVKIAAALGVGAAAVSFNECAAPKVVVLLGAGARKPEGDAACLTIDHPRDMIKMPELKRQAWTQLQAIKQFLC